VEDHQAQNLWVHLWTNLEEETYSHSWSCLEKDPMEDQESVLEEHVEVEGRDSPAEDFPQVYIEAFCSCYSTLS
jgi:hypothetical protein